MALCSTLSVTLNVTFTNKVLKYTPKKHHNLPNLYPQSRQSARHLHYENFTVNFTVLSHKPSPKTTTNPGTTYVYDPILKLSIFTFYRENCEITTNLHIPTSHQKHLTQQDRQNPHHPRRSAKSAICGVLAQMRRAFRQLSP